MVVDDMLYCSDREAPEARTAERGDQTQIHK